MMFEIFCLYGAHSANSMKCGLCIASFILIISSLCAKDGGINKLAVIFLVLSAVCLALAVLSPSEETYKAWLEIARRP